MLHIWDSTLSVALCMHSFIRKCIIPTCTILLSTADSLGIKISVALLSKCHEPKEAIQTPSIPPSAFMLCTNGTPRGSVFIQLCLFFFHCSIDSLTFHCEEPLLSSYLTHTTRGTEESLLRARVTGLLGNSSVGLLCDDPCWWPAVLSLCPSDEPWALECPVLHLISCSLLWAWRSDLWLSPPAGRPWPPRVSVFRAVRRPAARAASPHHVILPSTPPHPGRPDWPSPPPADGANTAAGIIAWSRPRSTPFCLWPHAQASQWLPSCQPWSARWSPDSLSHSWAPEVAVPRLRSGVLLACQNTAQVYRHKSAIKFALFQ